eukprot:TRINITY_DN74586_c0_g1_i1.p1 TRINITY_DN74586_c0_g1~~TRINITY_DN74586_c0_g1_i1.p1  ORF type:complete len:161 (+),score=29.32 TRINITY_DN74586_c0_g1_i1:72-554(+)
MNGLSFSDFEGSSLDSLYQRGFAGAKECSEMAKKLPSTHFALDVQNGRSAPSLATPGLSNLRALPHSGEGRNSHTVLPSQRGVPTTSASHRAQPTLTAVPMNDIGVMPGNSRVDHTWMPSREADARASAVSAVPAGTSAPALPAPPGGGQRGTFVGWKSS